MLQHCILESAARASIGHMQAMCVISCAQLCAVIAPNCSTPTRGPEPRARELLEPMPATAQYGLHQGMHRHQTYLAGCPTATCMQDSQWTQCGIQRTIRPLRSRRSRRPHSAGRQTVCMGSAGPAQPQKGVCQEQSGHVAPCKPDVCQLRNRTLLNKLADNLQTSLLACNSRSFGSGLRTVRNQRHQRHGHNQAKWIGTHLRTAKRERRTIDHRPKGCTR